MRTVSYTIESVNGRAWAHRTVTGKLAGAPVYLILRWLLEQLHLENAVAACDGEGNLTSLTLGAEAAPPWDSTSEEALKENIQRRVMNVASAGIFARAREAGIEQEYASMSDQVQELIKKGEGGHDNTDLHYAFELNTLLERIHNVTFVFEAPPIRSKAGLAVVTLLREATRAYLFELRRASVSLCRALLEAMLREAVPADELRALRTSPRRGDLELLIQAALDSGRLDRSLNGPAHEVRKAGNLALHGAEPDDAMAWKTLLDVRRIAAALYR